VKILVELCLIAPRPNSAHCHQTPNWCGEKLANAKARKQHIRIFVFLLTRLPVLCQKHLSGLLHVAQMHIGECPLRPRRHDEAEVMCGLHMED
jgi:hypothetical protein